MTCDWCGHDHHVTALCAKRPKWSRRGFLALTGAALAGSLLPRLPSGLAVGDDALFWDTLNQMTPEEMLQASLGVFAKTLELLQQANPTIEQAHALALFDRKE